MIPTVSVIIVFYEGLDKLFYCIDSLMNISFDLKRIELIIVNNSTTSIDISDTTRSRFHRMILVSPGFNSGYAGGNNFGYAQSQGEFVFFLNPDVFLEPNALEGTISALVRHPDWGAAMGKLLHYDWNMRASTTVIDSVGLIVKWNYRGFDRGQREQDNGQFSNGESIDAISGAAFFCRRSALQDIYHKDGYIFDESFFAYKEDVDLSIRLRNMGYDLRYLPILFGYHCRTWAARRKRGEVSVFTRYHSFKNRYLLIAKHMSLMSFLLSLPLMALQEFALLIYIHIFETDIKSAYRKVIKDATVIVGTRFLRAIGVPKHTGKRI